MRRWLWAIGMMAAVAGSAPVVAQPADGGASPNGGGRRGALPMEGVITDPDWVSKPTGDDVSRFYPPIAQFMALGGRAEMSCSVSALGTLEGCRIVSEIPAGMGFGAAALSMAAIFHMRPKAIDGSNVAGAQVNIPIRFAFPPTQAAPTEPPTQPPVSAAALALGHRLIAADGDEQSARMGIEFAVKQLLDQLRRDASAGGDTPETQVAIAAIEKAYEERLALTLEREARAAATKLSNADLTAAVAFVESPAGKAWVAERLERNSERQAEALEVGNTLREGSRRIFCLKVACEPSQLAPGAPSDAASKPLPSAAGR